MKSFNFLSVMVNLLALFSGTNQYFFDINYRYSERGSLLEHDGKSILSYLSHRLSDSTDEEIYVDVFPATEHPKSVLSANEFQKDSDAPEEARNLYSIVQKIVEKYNDQELLFVLKQSMNKKRDAAPDPDQHSQQQVTDDIKAKLKIKIDQWNRDKQQEKNAIEDSIDGGNAENQQPSDPVWAVKSNKVENETSSLDNETSITDGSMSDSDLNRMQNVSLNSFNDSEYSKPLKPEPETHFSFTHGKILENNLWRKYRSVTVLFMHSANPKHLYHGQSLQMNVTLGFAQIVSIILHSYADKVTEIGNDISKSLRPFLLERKEHELLIGPSPNEQYSPIKIILSGGDKSDRFYYFFNENNDCQRAQILENGTFWNVQDVSDEQMTNFNLRNVNSFTEVLDSFEGVLITFDKNFVHKQVEPAENRKSSGKIKATKLLKHLNIAREVWNAFKASKTRRISILKMIRPKKDETNKFEWDDKYYAVFAGAYLYIMDNDGDTSNTIWPVKLNGLPEDANENGIDSAIWLLKMQPGFQSVSWHPTGILRLFFGSVYLDYDFGAGVLDKQTRNIGDNLGLFAPVFGKSLYGWKKYGSPRPGLFPNTIWEKYMAPNIVASHKYRSKTISVTSYPLKTPIVNVGPGGKQKLLQETALSTQESEIAKILYEELWDNERL